MERPKKGVFGSIAAAASLVLLLSVSSVCADPAPQVLKGSKPNSTPATGQQQMKLTPQQLRERIAKMAAKGKITTGPKIPNLRSAGRGTNSILIGLLRAQKQAGDSERTAILAGARLAPKGAGAGRAPLTPAHTLSDPVPTDPAGAPPAGTPGATPPSNPGTPIGAPTSIGSRSTATGVMRLPSSTVVPQEPPAPAPRNPAGQGMSAVAVCQHPSIGSVNKQANGVVFTPDPQYNLYTIKGCMFGDTQGQAHLYGPFAAGHVALQIEFWSDSQIVAKVDPQVTGELDQDNVTLVLAPSGAPQMQKPGFKFYAMRETTLLTRIPRSTANLVIVTDTGGNPVNFGPQDNSKYYSPTTSSTSFAGMSAEVSRAATYVFNGNQDLFDFSKMKSGFTTDNMQLNTRVLPNDCGENYIVNGTWKTEWVGDNIRVTWQMQHCHEASSAVFGVGSMDVSNSDYGLSVWVVGPRGVNPWPNNLQ
ncbi:MAG: hypothetical protein LAN71_11000 [Acidobacteriia bacterium]|nr:hypothetical protein [Terriglobia bacterium]